MKQEEVELYLKYNSMFLSDFWNAGNKDLAVSINPRDNVESGVWFEATWKMKDGKTRHVESQRMKLMWERLIKQHLRDEEVTKDE